MTGKLTTCEISPHLVYTICAHVGTCETLFSDSVLLGNFNPFPLKCFFFFPKGKNREAHYFSQMMEDGLHEN